MARRSFPGYNCQCSAQEYPSSAQLIFLWMDLAFLKLPQHLFIPFLNAKRSWGRLCAVPPSAPLGSFSQSPGAFLPRTWMCFLALSAASASSSVTVQPPKPPPVILLP